MRRKRAKLEQDAFVDGLEAARRIATKWQRSMDELVDQYERGSLMRATYIDRRAQAGCIAFDLSQRIRREKAKGKKR